MDTSQKGEDQPRLSSNFRCKSFPCFRHSCRSVSFPRPEVSLVGPRAIARIGKSEYGEWHIHARWRFSKIPGPAPVSLESFVGCYKSFFPCFPCIFQLSDWIPAEMKEAIVHPGTRVTIVDSPIPKPKDDHVVIKVMCCGCNPKGWSLLNIPSTLA